MNQVIIVDDDEAVGDVIVRMLTARKLAAKGSDIPILFASSDKAWEYISQLPEKPRIVFSSVDIDTSARGQMNGLNLLEAVKNLFPGVIFISMSGTHSHQKEAMDKGANYFLPKPFSPADIERIFAENIAE